MRAPAASDRRAAPQRRALLTALGLLWLSGAALRMTVLAAPRGAATDVAMLFAATIAMGGGIAVMQPALPPIVRGWLPDRIGFATAVYTNGLLIGEIVAVSLTR